MSSIQLTCDLHLLFVVDGGAETAGVCRIGLGDVTLLKVDFGNCSIVWLGDVAMGEL